MALSESQTKALALVTDFRTHQASVWTNLSRADVADGLEVRINDPTAISSAASNLCGAASVTFELAKADPNEELVRVHGRSSRSCASRSARVRNAASQKAR